MTAALTKIMFLCALSAFKDADLHARCPRRLCALVTLRGLSVRTFYFFGKAVAPDPFFFRLAGLVEIDMLLVPGAAV